MNNELLYSVPTVFLLNCKARLLLGGIQVRLEAGLVVLLGLRGRGGVNSVDVTTEIIYRAIFPNISAMKNMYIHNKCIVSKY